MIIILQGGTKLWHTLFLIHALAVEHVLVSAQLELSLLVIHSTLSMQMLASIVVHALVFAQLEQSASNSFLAYMSKTTVNGGLFLCICRLCCYCTLFFPFEKNRILLSDVSPYCSIKLLKAFLLSILLLSHKIIHLL